MFPFIVGTFVGVAIMGLFSSSAYDKGREDASAIRYCGSPNCVLRHDDR